MHFTFILFFQLDALFCVSNYVLTVLLQVIAF